MAPEAILTSFIYGDGFDFSGVSNEYSVTCEATALDKTTFRSGSYNEFAGGLKTVTFDAKGFHDAAAGGLDPTAFTDFSSTGKVYTVGLDETEGDPALMFQGSKAKYDMFGTINEMAPYSLSVVGTDGVGVVRGVLAKEKADVSATGATGTALNLGAVSASQYLYATFHLFGTAGTTITAVVESDDANNFPSATTRITFGPLTAIGGTWGTRVAGSITDTWYRLRVTAITGTWSVACAIGIQ